MAADASPSQGVPRPARVSPVSLTDLAAAVDGTLHGADRAVTGVTADTGFVRPGDLFVGRAGARTHGASFAGDALAAGAVAVLTDETGRSMVPSGTPVIVTEAVLQRVGHAAALVYGNPSESMNVLGVTGTSGKTTTTFLMEAGLRAAGRATGLIGTVGIHIGDEVVKTSFTTPEASELQALLAVMRERGITDVAMEVSSHALELGRVDGTSFATTGFTNLSEDHLDFHGDMQSYFAAKASLFTDASRAVVVVDEVDDGWAWQLVRSLSPGVTTVSRRANGGYWYVSGGIQHEFDGSTQFVVRRDAEFGQEHVPIEAGCAIPGDYNVDNVLLALAMLAKVGVEPSAEVVDAIAHATVPGRMEPIQLGQNYLAIVDYSHKPAAVDGAIRALRPLTRNRLIVVLGCGGDRDRGKRPHMGEIAARGADSLIVTDDNPRTEDPAEIRRAMLDGARAVPEAERGQVREVGDRREAIRSAVSEARPGDTVLVAGKGHEPGQEIDGVIYPFDDRDELRAALREMTGPA